MGAAVSAAGLAFYPGYVLVSGTELTLRSNWLWLAIGVFAYHGLAEELMWRGYAFRRLRQGRTFNAAIVRNEGARQALLGRIRSAASEAAAADAVREMIGAQLTEFARLMDGDRPDVRASLLAAQFLGMVFARFVVGVEPLASMDGEEIAHWLGPTFDLYLTGPLNDSG
jgi:hypothetical protein